MASKTRKLREETKNPEEARVVHRSGGYYVKSEEGELGPFRSAAEARQALVDVKDDPSEEEALEEGESLQEAEAEIGVAGWIDPDSGEIAEDWVPRLEEH